MYGLKLSALILMTVPIIANANDCATGSGNKTFCIGDHVVNESGLYEEDSIGTISDVHVEGHEEVVIEITWKNNRTLRTRYLSSYLTKSEQLGCGIFSGENVCVGDTIQTATYSNRMLPASVLAVTKDKIVYSIQLGPDKGQVRTTSTLLSTKNQVEGFDHISYGEKVPNGFKSFDTINFYDPSAKVYGVFLGDIGQRHRLTKKQLQFRLSQASKTTVAYQNWFQLDTIVELENPSEEKAIEKLKSNAKAWLMEHCEEYFFEKNFFDVKNLKLTYENIIRKTTYRRIVSIDHQDRQHDMYIYTPNPRYIYIASGISATGECVHK